MADPTDSNGSSGEQPEKPLESDFAPLDNFATGVGHAATDAVMGIVNLASESAKALWDVATNEPYAREAAWETVKSMAKDANTLLNPLASPEDKEELGERMLDSAEKMAKGIAAKAKDEYAQGGVPQVAGYVAFHVTVAALTEGCGEEAEAAEAAEVGEAGEAAEVGEAAEAGEAAKSLPEGPPAQVPKHTYRNVKDTEALDDINGFLGKGKQTDVNPFTGETDKNRIFSVGEDGKVRSVRQGSHEMRNPNKQHYHLEEWDSDGNVAKPDQSVNILKTRKK